MLACKNRVVVPLNRRTVSALRPSSSLSVAFSISLTSAQYCRQNRHRNLRETGHLYLCEFLALVVPLQAGLRLRAKGAVRLWQLLQ